MRTRTLNHVLKLKEKNKRTSLLALFIWHTRLLMTLLMILIILEQLNTENTEISIILVITT